MYSLEPRQFCGFFKILTKDFVRKDYERAFNSSQNTFTFQTKVNTSESKPEPLQSTTYVLIGIGIAVMLTLVCIIGLFIRRTLSKKPELNPLELISMSNGEKTLYESLRRIDPQQLVFGKSLGNGRFGLVRKAKLNTQYGIQTVAVKSVRPKAAMIYHDGLVSEINLHSSIKSHANVVEFIGAVEVQEENTCGHICRKFLVMEFCEGGDLKSHLIKMKSQQRRESTTLNENSETGYISITWSTSEEQLDLAQYKLLLNWSKEIACGMDFLVSQNILHNDLAARNVLFSLDLTAKISDLGLSRKMEDSCGIYIKVGQEARPYRWMSIESNEHNEFSSYSDCWSYGVTLWEIFSLGELPYPNYDYDELKMRLRTRNERLEKPEFCEDELVYQKMRECWNSIPSLRPTFTELEQFFTTLGK